MPKGEYRTWRDKAEALERELKSKGLDRDDNDVTIQYLLDSAAALIDAAKVLIDMRRVKEKPLEGDDPQVNRS